MPEKQIRATGPRTLAGKRRSRTNATKHGLLASDLVLAGENPAELQELQREMRAIYQPVGPVEEHLVNRCVNLMWRIRRVPIAEKALISKSSGFIGVADNDPSDLPNQKTLLMIERNGTTTSLKASLLLCASNLVLQLSKDVRERGFDCVEDLGTIHSIYGTVDSSLVPEVPGQMLAAYIAKHHEMNGATAEEIEEALTEEISMLLQSDALRLAKLYGEQTTHDIRCNSLSALLPPTDALSRIQRYETHLSREFEKALEMLTCIQRERMTLRHANQ